MTKTICLGIYDAEFANNKAKTAFLNKMLGLAEAEPQKYMVDSTPERAINGEPMDCVWVHVPAEEYEALEAERKAAWGEI